VSLAPFHIAEIPGIYSIFPASIPGLFNVYYGTLDTSTPKNIVKADIVASVKRVVESGTINVTGVYAPKLVAFDNHTRYEFTVDAKAIKAGFYERLGALQGVKGTGWTGVAWGLIVQLSCENLLGRLFRG
jgi:hypothetical protein